MADDNQPQGQVAGGDAAQQQPQYSIQRVYCKDISFETPNSPAVFSQEWKPEVQLDIDTKANVVAEGLHEVILTVTVTAKVGETVAFLCEVQQAGIFAIHPELPEANRAQLIGSASPTTLFPYARETISNLVNRGTFPALNLAPVNFDAIFNAYMQKRAQEMQGQQEQPQQLDS